MTSGRIYKKPMSKDDAIEELKRCAGTQFDPVLVDKFIEILSNGQWVLENNTKKMTIQSEKEEKKILQRIVAASEEFLQSAAQNLITRRLLMIS